MYTKEGSDARLRSSARCFNGSGRVERLPTEPGWQFEQCEQASLHGQRRYDYRQFASAVSWVLIGRKIAALSHLCCFQTWQNDIIQKVGEVVGFEVDVSGKRFRLLEGVLRGMVVIG
jgi:hypothetical protein